MRPIFLIGYMCSGKSTLGRALAHAFDMPFVDLDQIIEKEQGRTIKEIFDSEGEAAFRKIEQDTLRKLSHSGKAIIACGGGTPCVEGAMELMNSLGTTVWLKPTWERLLPRLMHGKRKRPLIMHISSADEMLQFYNEAMERREPYYSQAKYQFDSSRLESNGEIDRTIEIFKREILSKQ